jgi:ABC-type uncharacterized transport system ATPase subunit
MGRAGRAFGEAEIDGRTGGPPYASALRNASLSRRAPSVTPPAAARHLPLQGRKIGAAFSEREHRTMSEHPVLETRDLTIRFGGHVAVDAVSCAFRRGTLTAIVGPNGAGKTTYFNLISGQLKATSGRVLLNGEDITRLSVPERCRRGIGRAFQLTNLFPGLTVRENVRLVAQARAGRGGALFAMAEADVALIEKAEHVLAEVGLLARADLTVGALSHGDQRKLEVARFSSRSAPTC